MTVTSTQIQLLREVIGGKSVFSPNSGSDRDLNAFQLLAEELLELDENDYITGCRSHHESRTGKRQIDRVL